VEFHPLAETNPLMEGEEFDELVRDVADNGLLEPIVTYEGAVLDGRNRWRACEVAGVEPETVEFTGTEEEARAFVNSKETRRHSTKGQRAMGVAKRYPEGQQGKKSTSLETKEVSTAYLSKARLVLREAPDLADKVLIGAVGLDAAYQEARERRDAATDEGARLTVLQGAYPDLADKVTAEELTLREAEAAAREREAVARAQRSNAFAVVSQAVPLASVLGSAENVADKARLVLDYEDEMRDQRKCSRRDLLEACKRLREFLPEFIHHLNGEAP
jgi:hypothetical protein